jgi:16S rRNA (uracil1498-N3)-methyltransferase
MRSRADAVPAFVWVPELPPDDTTLVLDPATLHHVRRVCRARPGDSVALTDGRGTLAHGALDPEGRVFVTGRRIEPAPPAATIACGAPEGDRADWLIEKLAEFGIGAFQPLDTARARWRPERARHDRWERLARAALGQSRGAWLLEVRAPIGWDEFLGSVPPGSARWVADPEGTRAVAPTGNGVRPWLGVVGPAAGLDDQEKFGLVTGGFQSISLSSRRLRTETAALGLAALWAAGFPEGNTGN